jgi:hypothetical protein
MGITKLPRFPVMLDGQTVQIGTTGELVVALDVLQGQHDRAPLEQLREHLPQIIRSGRELLTVMKSLSADDQIFLLEALGEHLAGIPKVAERLRDLLAMLALIPVFLNRIRMEERLLTEEFQDAYRQYKEKTKALIPFVY